MPATNVLMTIEDLQFPDFGKDDSKKNFRMLFTLICNDAKGTPATVLAALPPLKEDNWTWKPDKKKAQNYVPNDGHGHLEIGTLTTAARMVLHDVLEIISIDVKIIDIGDKNALTYFNGTLKKLSGVGLEILVSGAGGMFAKILKSAQADVQKAADEVLDAWAKASDKRLFQGEFVRSDLAALAPGPFKISGKGVLEAGNDGLGHYSASFKLTKVG